jgi:tripartite-type tricarboxylate transporter receptor subunit TctC
MTRRQSLKHLAGVALASVAGGAAAQAYPTKPISLVIPFTPGGGTDFVCPAELIAAGRAGNGITCATAGNGSLGHLFGEQLRQATGMKLRQIHYKGAAPAITDVIGGEADVACDSLGRLLARPRSGTRPGRLVRVFPAADGLSDGAG